jgi:hypothetical protein
MSKSKMQSFKVALRLLSSCSEVALFPNCERDGDYLRGRDNHLERPLPSLVEIQYKALSI